MTKQQILDCGLPGVDYIPQVHQDLFGVGSAVQAGTGLAAAGLQSAAVNRATDAQSQSAANTLNFQKGVYNTQQQQLGPYYNWGTQGAGQLAAGTIGDVSKGEFTNPVNYNNANFNMSGYAPIWGDQGLNQNPQQAANFQFSTQDLQNDPGYQFTLNQGLQAQQRMAAATGATGGGEAKAIAQYTTGLANTTANDALQRQLAVRQNNASQQNQNFNQYLQQNENLQNQNNQLEQLQMQAYQANTGNALNAYNAAQQNQSNAFNRYSALAGIGQQAAAGLGAAGNQAAANYGATNAQLGNALSAGSAAQGNIWGNALSSVGNAGSTYLSHLYSQNGN